MPGSGLAIIAGRGDLPRLLAEDCAARGAPYLVVTFEGAPLGWVADHPTLVAAFEKPGRLFAGLRTAGCGAVTFAGGMRRPDLNPMRFDMKMVRLAPRILSGLKSGDDATLRLLANIVEAEGFELRAPHDLLGHLVAAQGVVTTARPSAEDRKDAERAVEIVAALGGADVGQGAVVAQGLCLGIETIQGTDEMLAFVARTGAAARPDPDGARGVLYKAPKPGQDWRVDLPAVGPQTVRAAATAGLAGIVVQAGGVMVLSREEAMEEANREGLFIWGREGAR